MFTGILFDYACAGSVSVFWVVLVPNVAMVMIAKTKQNIWKKVKQGQIDVRSWWLSASIIKCSSGFDRDPGIDDENHMYITIMSIISVP